MMESVCVFLVVQHDVIMMTVMDQEQNALVVSTAVSCHFWQKRKRRHGIFIYTSTCIVWH